MTPEQFKKLKRGDYVRHVSPIYYPTYVVMGNYGDHVTAVRTVDMTNPAEWVLVDECGEEIKP